MIARTRVIAVYKITNTVSKKFYIGSSSNLHTRWICHKNNLRGNKHRNPKIQASWNKHGEEAFHFEKLSEFDSITDMEEAEQHLINKHWGNPLLMNLARFVACPMRGRLGKLHPRYGIPMSDEQKSKISKAALGNSNRKGRKHSAETRAKMSAKVQKALAEGRAGKSRPTEETRAKMAKSAMGNKYATGTKRTTAQKKAISKRMKGNTNSMRKGRAKR